MKILISFFSLVVLIHSTHAQQNEYAAEIVKTLTSREFKGRGYTGNGHTMAAEYIRKEYKKIGLIPMGKDFFQYLTISVNVFPGKLKCVVNGIELTPGAEFLVDPASCSMKGKYKVTLVKKEDLLSDAVLKEIIRNTDGRILVIDARDFKAIDKDHQKKADERVANFMYDPALPNAATIVLTKEKLTWGISTLQAKKTSLTIQRDLEITENAEIFVDIEARLTEIQTQNVAGYISGTQVPDSFLVVTAHYDHLGMMGTETLFPGANDNASGVAMMLTLARHFAKEPLKYSMVFIALTAEEAGLKGAAYFVENPLINLNKIRFLVNFDLAGTGEEGIKVVNGSVFKKEFDLIKRLNDDRQYLKSVQIRGAACISDHCMFYQKQVPCFYIYTLGGIQAYHDIFDKAETLPLSEFADYAKLMIDFFENLK